MTKETYTIEVPPRTIVVTVSERKYDVLVEVDADPNPHEHQIIANRLSAILEDCEHSGKWLIYCYPSQARAWKRQKDGSWQAWTLRG